MATSSASKSKEAIATSRAMQSRQSARIDPGAKQQPDSPAIAKFLFAQAALPLMDSRPSTGAPLTDLPSNNDAARRHHEPSSRPRR